jgi:mono/diheme cytochrome c family protein
MRLLLLLAASLVFSGCNMPQGPASESAEAGWKGSDLEAAPEVVADGKRIAQAQCASCHATDSTSSRSPNPAAPPLRDVLALYEADNLAYRFIEGMRVGHDDMPRFDFDVRAADALLAYIASITRK